MKRFLAVAGLSLSLSLNSFAITKSEAVEKINKYLEGSNHVSKVVVCENEKFYIGEAILEGYEELGNFVRKVYVSKKDGSIIPTASMHNDSCYMLKK